MSIVGTRPPLISETNLYEPHHKATEIEASKSQGNDEENHYIYYHRIYGNTRLLLKTCFKLIIEDVHIAIIQKRKKYKK